MIDVKSRAKREAVYLRNKNVGIEKNWCNQLCSSAKFRGLTVFKGGSGMSYSAVEVKEFTKKIYSVSCDPSPLVS